MSRAAPLGPGEREPEPAATTINSTLRLDEVLRLIVAELRRLVTHEGVALLLLDPGDVAFGLAEAALCLPKRPKAAGELAA